MDRSPFSFHEANVSRNTTFVTKHTHIASVEHIDTYILL